MTVPSFGWAEIIGSANSFLSNEFVAGCLITIIALAVVVKIAEFLKSVIDGE
jgi:hypothetical protein